MDHIAACAVIGVVAGLLAGQVMRGKFSILGDVIVSVIGAMLGGYLFGKLEMANTAGWAGAAVFAAIGAFALLVGLRMLGSVD